MSTRKTTSILLVVTSLVFAAMAHATDFSMAGGDMSVEAVASVASTSSATMEPVSRASSGGDTMGYVPAGVSSSTEDAAPNRAAIEPEAAPVAAPARAVVPATTPAAPSRSRSGNRWQSLVPGAIK